MCVFVRAQAHVSEVAVAVVVAVVVAVIVVVAVGCKQNTLLHNWTRTCETKMPKICCVELGGNDMWGP